MEIRAPKIANSERAVAIVKYHPSIKAFRMDTVDYAHIGIMEIIPAWKTTDGKLISVETGEEVNTGNNFQERRLGLGVEFRYPDGSEIILIRDPYTREQYFSPKGELKGGPCYNICPFNKEELERKAISTL